VESGQEIEAGSVIGTLGNSGFSSGPHLHLHFMDGSDPLRASPLPVALALEGGRYAPLAGEIVSG
jgi:murein DD-endopeptidase MepM/ murein hydrolase activator NlpD